MITSLRNIKLNVNVVNYDISDHMPVVCYGLFGKTKHNMYYEKSVHNFSKFDVMVFLNYLNIQLKNRHEVVIENHKYLNYCWREFECILIVQFYTMLQVSLPLKKNIN